MVEHVCPLCNGLVRFHSVCPRCGAPLEDEGMTTDYLDDYSPYEITPRVKQSTDRCIHLLHCANCGNESYAIVQNDVI
ncbi:hypothetical protein EDD64_10329 [Effusibacillus lacus]|nr:hypothetical protein EDD64_10329 [Effusibacillus lacus]